MSASGGILGKDPRVLGTMISADPWDRLVFVTDDWFDRVAAYECDAYA